MVSASEVRGKTKATRVYSIYAIERKDDGMTYVGLTSRPLPARMKAHAYDAMRQGRSNSPGSLASAIRQVILRGHRFSDGFRWRILAKGLSEEDARQAEADWIERLNCFRPRGFNKLRGGASAGGPANARPVSFKHPTLGQLDFESLYQAIWFRNTELRHAGKREYEPSTIYARIDVGWSLGEALGYIQHADGRSRRAAFKHNGAELDRLRIASEATGIPVDTLRSRLHRAKQAGLVQYDLADDRRTSGKRQKRTEILLPHPGSPGGGRNLNSASFARVTGVPKATVVSRVAQLRNSGVDLAVLPDEDLIEQLTIPKDRRRIITLTLPNGEVLTGGEREVIRRVLGDTGLSATRMERLGESAIRRRLRLVKCSSGSPISWSFGFARVSKEA